MSEDQEVKPPLHEIVSTKNYLMSSRLRHTVGLALVLSNVVVHQGDDVGPESGTCSLSLYRKSPITSAHLTGALKTAGRQTVVPVGAFLSLCTPIRGRAAARDILASSEMVASDVKL